MQPQSSWSRYYGQSSANYNNYNYDSSSSGRRNNNPTYVHHHSYDRRDRPDYRPPSDQEFDAQPIEKDPGFYHGERYYYEPPDDSTPAPSIGKPLGATHVVVEHKVSIYDKYVSIKKVLCGSLSYSPANDALFKNRKFTSLY